MKLSRRAFIVIIPVLAVGYAIGLFSVYLEQRDRLLRSEQTGIDNALTILVAELDGYAHFQEVFVTSLKKSDPLKTFLVEQDASYRAFTLGTSIETSLREVEQFHSDYLTLALLDSTGELLYYLENSGDPFSSVSDRALVAASNQLHSGESAGWALWQSDEGNYRLAFMSLIDAETLLTPKKASRRESVLVVQSVVEPSSFQRQAEAVQARYDATLTFSRAETGFENPEKGKGAGEFQLRASRASSTGLQWQLVASQAYIEKRLVSIKRPLALSLVGLVLFSGFTILLLIRRYITGPIAELDQNLENVIEGRETTIRADESAQDEIAHIARMFRKLYGELSLAYAHSKAMAETDQLTRLHNLTYLNHHGQAMMNAAQAQGLSLGLMYVDLDNFKFVNDRFGHDTGDELLVSLAKSFQALLERYRGQTPLAPILFRIAGDEFGIMMAQSAVEPDACHKLATEIVSLFSTGYRLGKTLLPISASIGIAECPADGVQLTQLMSCADSAMYQAKSLGKNQLAHFSRDIAAKANRERDIEHALKAVDCDTEFFLVFMPIIAVATGTANAVEVLLRWNSSRLGPVGPAEFVPIAEATGLFEKIDRWVVSESLRLYRNVSAELGDDVKLSINLSSAQLCNKDLAEQIILSARQYDVEPAMIQLEMTETIGIDFSDQMQHTLQTLRTAGFGVAIDDFGAGYTSLAQLVEYPVDVVKLDRLFITRMMDAGKSSMLPPLIDLCHLQNIEVTAEGVENEAQLRMLIDSGCDALQGYYFGQPVPLSRLQAASEQWRIKAAGARRLNLPGKGAQRL
ncbi:putative bifunctional diguanylate cyclase/phosphodiesterase [Allohahella sp. A8]|uniref:putative bifunctional diguanylate cyclase/phosphodiesterase n=1 Tax=Allohahella sp. A8 TaxID=3141461 RepID=UPI003A805C0E